MKTKMAAVPVQSLRVSEIKDPTVLFERYSTDEIRAVERKVRGEIEQKKEELRQMVGERYRDLIEAADTIGKMTECSEKVVQSIQDMQNYCHSLKHNKHTPQSSRAEVDKQSQEKFYAMAAQIKLLLEMPERMWSALEGAQYLQATQLHLLCAHLHRLLHLDTATASYSPVLSRFPILIQQVAAAGHFRSTILLDSKSVLRGRAVSDQAIAEALVATMLLEDSSPRQALADFLLARTASIQGLLKQPQHGAGIRSHVCSLVELLVTTLYQAHAVFYLPPEGHAADPGLGYGLLFSTLENVTAGKGRKVLHGEVSAGSWFKYLPLSVTDFQPTLRTLAQPIQSEQLRDTLQHWIDTCKEDMCSGVNSLLIYVKSMKGLASIRDTVCDLLSSDSISQHWSGVCARLLEKPLDLWHDLLQPLFLRRLQVITQEGMGSISSSCKQLLSSTLQELEGDTASQSSRFESDVSSFLWCESQSDLPSDAAWVSVSQRSSRPESGLSMKTHALTPRVQNFCATLDFKLKAQLEDLGHFLPSDASVACLSRYTDGPAVEQALSERCTACLTDIMSSIRNELAASSGRMNSVLFLARLCQSLRELCPSLKQCILGRQGESRNTGSPRVQSRKLGKTGMSKSLELSPAQVTWVRMKEELLACSTEAYRLWSSAVSQNLVKQFASSLHTTTVGTVLITATNWEELEIQEEAESGNTVVSKIHLPVQPSWYIQSLLFHLCLEVNKVGGHALPRITLTELLRSCLDQVLSEYDQLTRNQDVVPPITQNRGLQLLFDVRYVSAALTARLEDTRSSRSHMQPRIQQICDALESHIDPFDLDVFTPHLNSNLNRLTQRTSVLLGLLTGAEKQFTPRSGNLSSQEPYNILPLASSQIRFGLLPLSMTNSRKAKSSTRSSDITRPLTAPSSNPVPEDTFRPGNLFRQLAHQEEEPVGPSLFKLGWLSSMAK